MKYVEPIGGLANDPYVDANPAGGVEGSPVPAAAIEHPMREIVAVIQAAGIVPSEFVLTQLLLALRSAGVFQTPSQFDNTTKAATTAFVQAARGQLSGVSAFNANTVLTASHAGALVYAYGASALTFTLPAISTMLVGAAIRISNLSNFALTVARAGADSFGTDGTATPTSIVIQPGASADFVPLVGATTWLVSGTGVLNYSKDFAVSLNNSGYQKLPSGLIMQWGFVTTVAGNGSGGGVGLSFSFPIAFPTAFRSMVLTPVQTSAPIIGAWYDAQSTSAARVTTNGIAGTVIYYFAIGY